MMAEDKENHPPAPTPALTKGPDKKACSLSGRLTTSSTSSNMILYVYAVHHMLLNVRSLQT